MSNLVEKLISKSIVEHLVSGAVTQHYLGCISVAFPWGGHMSKDASHSYTTDIVYFKKEVILSPYNEYVSIANMMQYIGLQTC